MKTRIGLFTSMLVTLLLCACAQNQTLRPGYYVSEGEMASALIIQDNHEFTLLGPPVISAAPSGQYQIQGDRLSLMTGDETHVFTIDGEQLVFESGTWLENWVEQGEVFHYFEEMPERTDTLQATDAESADEPQAEETGKPYTPRTDYVYEGETEWEVGGRTMRLEDIPENEMEELLVQFFLPEITGDYDDAYYSLFVQPPLSQEGMDYTVERYETGLGYESLVIHDIILVQQEDLDNPDCIYHFWDEQLDERIEKYRLTSRYVIGYHVTQTLTEATRARGPLHDSGSYYSSLLVGSTDGTTLKICEGGGMFEVGRNPDWYYPGAVAEEAADVELTTPEVTPPNEGSEAPPQPQQNEPPYQQPAYTPEEIAAVEQGIIIRVVDGDGKPMEGVYFFLETTFLDYEEGPIRPGGTGGGHTSPTDPNGIIIM